MIIDIRRLCSKYGRQLTYCTIVRENDYCDIVSNDELCASDGEVAWITETGDGYIKLTTDGISTFMLSTKEYEEGVVQ